MYSNKLSTGQAGSLATINKLFAAILNSANKTRTSQTMQAMLKQCKEKISNFVQALLQKRTADAKKYQSDLLTLLRIGTVRREILSNDLSEERLKTVIAEFEHLDVNKMLGDHELNSLVALLGEQRSEPTIDNSPLRNDQLVASENTSSKANLIEEEDYLQVSLDKIRELRKQSHFLQAINVAEIVLDSLEHNYKDDEMRDYFMTSLKLERSITQFDQHIIQSEAIDNATLNAILKEINLHIRHFEKMTLDEPLIISLAEAHLQLANCYNKCGLFQKANDSTFASINYFQKLGTDQVSAKRLALLQLGTHLNTIAGSSEPEVIINECITAAQYMKDKGIVRPDYLDQICSRSIESIDVLTDTFSDIDNNKDIKVGSKVAFLNQFIELIMRQISMYDNIASIINPNDQNNNDGTNPNVTNTNTPSQSMDECIDVSEIISNHKKSHTKLLMTVIFKHIQYELQYSNNVSESIRYFTVLNNINQTEKLIDAPNISKIRNTLANRSRVLGIASLDNRDFQTALKHFEACRQLISSSPTLLASSAAKQLQADIDEAKSGLAQAKTAADHKKN